MLEAAAIPLKDWRAREKAFPCHLLTLRLPAPPFAEDAGQLAICLDGTDLLLTPDGNGGIAVYMHSTEEKPARAVQKLTQAMGRDGEIRWQRTPLGPPPYLVHAVTGGNRLGLHGRFHEEAAALQFMAEKERRLEGHHMYLELEIRLAVSRAER